MEKHLTAELQARAARGFASDGRTLVQRLLLPVLAALLALSCFSTTVNAEQSDATETAQQSAATADADNQLAGKTLDKAEQAKQQGLFRIYRSNMLKKTYRHIVYPESAINKDHEGTVVLKLTLNRTGKVTKIDYETRARYNSLNKAAYKAVKRAMPFPAVPRQVSGESFELLMPIKFRLQS